MASAPVSGTTATGPQRWQRYLADMRNFSADKVPLETQGLLVRVTGLVLEAVGVRAPVGAVCEVRSGAGMPPVWAEVVGFDGDRAFLMPSSEVHGLSSGASVTPVGAAQPLGHSSSAIGFVTML